MKKLFKNTSKVKKTLLNPMEMIQIKGGNDLKAYFCNTSSGCYEIPAYTVDECDSKCKSANGNGAYCREYCI